jgi:hypothetical protein
MVMRRDEMWHRITMPAFRIGGLGAVAIAAVAVPVTATASSHVASPYAHNSAAAGLVYGGLTSQGWPVVIEVSKNRRRVARATAALHLTCTDGASGSLTDSYGRLLVNKRRKFSARFGPTHVRQDDGTISDFAGSISGTFNRARTRVSGKWRLQITDHDSSGAVIHECGSGSVRWSAKQ